MQSTPLRLVPAAAGSVWPVQALPFHVATRGCSRLNDGLLVDPTATQNVAVAHETPPSSAPVAGKVKDAMLQAVPSPCSMSGCGLAEFWVSVAHGEALCDRDARDTIEQRGGVASRDRCRYLMP